LVDRDVEQLAAAPRRPIFSSLRRAQEASTPKRGEKK
jgi:hypothetical protein